MSKSKSVWDEAETWRSLGLDNMSERRDLRLARMKDEDFLRCVDNQAMERAADRVEELSASYVDWRGFPLPGFESPGS